MTENNSRQDATKRSPENGKFDRALDTALAKFATVEPRTGLEERVLANLRAEQERADAHSRWRWPAVAALATVIVVFLSVAWRSGKPVQKITTQHPPATVQTDEQAETQVANNSGSSPTRPYEASGKRLKTHAVSHALTAVSPAPKLDEFPSPLPLSEQEKMLARYVANYPEHAALIAQARTEELRRDSIEEMRESLPASAEDSQQLNK